METRHMSPSNVILQSAYVQFYEYAAPKVHSSLQDFNTRLFVIQKMLSVCRIIFAA